MDIMNVAIVSTGQTQDSTGLVWGSAGLSDNGGNYIDLIFVCNNLSLVTTLGFSYVQIDLSEGQTGYFAGRCEGVFIKATGGYTILFRLYRDDLAVQFTYQTSTLSYNNFYYVRWYWKSTTGTYRYMDTYFQFGTDPYLMQQGSTSPAHVTWTNNQHTNQVGDLAININHIIMYSRLSSGEKYAVMFGPGRYYRSVYTFDPLLPFMFPEAGKTDMFSYAGMSLGYLQSYSPNQIFAIDYKSEISSLQDTINGLLAAKTNPYNTYGNKAGNTGASGSIKDKIDVLFGSTIDDLGSNMTTTFTPNVRSTSTGDPFQDAINLIQNAIDAAIAGLDKSIVWILTEALKTFKPLASKFVEGVNANIGAYSDDIFGWFATIIFPEFALGYEVGQVLVTMLNTLTGDVLDLVDPQIDYTDLAPYWNAMIHTLDMNDDDYVAVYLPGPSIGFTTIGSLMLPTKIHSNALNLNWDTVDFIFLIWWCYKWGLAHPTLLGEAIPIPVGLMYIAIKDWRVPVFSDLFNSLGLIVKPAFFSGYTDGFTFKDATLPWFGFGIGYAVAKHLGVKFRQWMQIMNKVYAKHGLSIKDVIKRLKEPGDSMKLREGREVTIRQQVDLNSAALDSLANQLTTLGAQLSEVIYLLKQQSQRYV